MEYTEDWDFFNLLKTTNISLVKDFTVKILYMNWIKKSQ